MWGTISFLVLFVEGSHFLGGICEALQPQGSRPRHRDGERGLGNAAGLMLQEGGRDTAGLLPISVSWRSQQVTVLVCLGVCVCVAGKPTWALLGLGHWCFL